MLEETMRLLAPAAGQVAVDCTVGLGGHSLKIARAIGLAGRLVVFDLDAANLAQAAQNLAASGARASVVPIHDNFASAPHHLKRLGLRADIVLADLGFSSNQMDDPDRGFSFASDGPLDMRLNVEPGASQRAPITAADLLARSTERELADLIYQFGEEPMARKIARKLVQNRQVEPIRSTARLAELVKTAYGRRARFSRIHPATRTFMALRIAVNDELGALNALLESIVQAAEQVDRGGWLNQGSRVAVISFHSLEDRLVKRAFADLEKRGLARRLTPGGKPLQPSDQEVQNNPRSRSAKLRAVRIGDPTIHTG